MTEMTCLVDLVTHEWIDDGSRVADGVRYVRERVPRNPDARREKRGDAPGLIVAKTQAEIDAWDAAALEARVADDYERRALKALSAAIWKGITGAWPTAAQKTQLKADFITAWKALP